VTPKLWRALLAIARTDPALAEQFVTDAAFRAEVVAKLGEMEQRDSALLDAVIEQTAA
jgi:hypothetical protein